MLAAKIQGDSTNLADSAFSLPIEGMTCASCVARIERSLNKVEGVQSVNVNLATERADIQASGFVDRKALVQAVEDAGYSVPSASVELAVEGMTCASCVGRVERAIKAIPGVTEATVNLAMERASDVLPTPGGPTKHRIGPFSAFTRCWTARYSRMRSLTFLSP